MARIAVIVVAVICAPIVLAQQPAPAFEAASIKVSTEPGGAIGQVAPDRFRMSGGLLQLTESPPEKVQILPQIGRRFAVEHEREIHPGGCMRPFAFAAAPFHARARTKKVEQHLRDRLGPVREAGSFGALKRISGTESHTSAIEIALPAFRSVRI